jgi:GT2 family glycosyltransferase
MTKIAIVILNWNGIGFLRRFLPYVTENTSSEQVEIWVADNGSTDGSMGFLREVFPEVRLLEFDSNYGFAGGYNKALAEIKAEYYILLNSDVMVTPGWTEPLLRVMENDKSIAACMPKIKDLRRREYFEHAGAAGGFIDFLGYPFCRGRVFDVIEKDTGQYDDMREVFWTTGACMIVRGAEWHNEGGLDETFFAHMEEIDLCWRLKNSGKKIVVCPSSVVYHLGGGTLPQYHPRKTFWNFRNSLLMLLKNLPPGKLYLVFIRLVFDWLSVIKFIAALSFANAFAVLRAHLSFFRFVPLYLKKRSGQHQRNITTKWYRSGKDVTLRKHGEIYTGSVVINFFILKRKHFSQIFK